MVFDQDFHNMPRIQAGLKTMKPLYVTFGDYRKSKIRYFHELLEERIQSS